MPFTLATYNVLDLFDAAPGVDPSALRSPSVLTRAHLDAKLTHLASVLAQANADVVALQEVGSAQVVRELTARLPALGYGEPIVGTADARGIRCALVSRLPILASRVHTAESLPFPVFVAGDLPPFGARIPLRRGIVGARIDAGPLGPVEVLVVHFKSSRPLPLRDSGGEIAPVTSRELAEAHLRTLVWRGAEALFVRGLVDELCAGSDNVLVAGDFNDHPDSTVLRIVAGTGPRALSSCADLIPEAARFSVLHRGEREEIDHVLATPDLRRQLTSALFLNEELRDHGEDDENAPPPVDSDHAAMVVAFG